MFFIFLFFVIALFNALEQARLLKTNQLLQQALRELEVEQEFQVAVGEDSWAGLCQPGSPSTRNKITGVNLQTCKQRCETASSCDGVAYHSGARVCYFYSGDLTVWTGSSYLLYTCYRVINVLDPCVCSTTWSDSESGGSCGDEQVGCPAKSCDGAPRWCLTANDGTCATDLGGWTLCDDSTPVFGTVEVMVGAYGLKGEIGKCPAGKALTLEQCKNEVSFGKKWGGSGNYGKWYSPESCGCYIDQNGKRYFNRNTWYCTSDVGEKLICVVPEPPKTCHNTFRFLETKDGQCSASVTFPSRSLSCPKNYARIRTEKECRELLTKNSKNIHWRGSTSPFTSNWPKGCVIHKKRNFYQGYFNTKSSECNTCDTDVAPVCKLV
jgi:hypothetical protein